MKNLKFINKLIYLVNALVATMLLLSYVLPYFPPKKFAILSVLSLGVPFLILINVLFCVYWLIKLKKQCILSLVVLVIGYFTLGSFYKFTSSGIEPEKNDLSVMNYNVRLFNIYNWIPEKGIEVQAVDFIKSKLSLLIPPIAYTGTLEFSHISFKKLIPRPGNPFLQLVSNI